MLSQIQTIKNVISSIETTRKVVSPKDTQSFSLLISSDFTQIKFLLEDTETLTTHFLLLQPDSHHLGMRYLILDHSLPHGVTFTLTNSLREHAEEFIQHINRLSYFMNGLKFIDMYACVQSPVIKTTRDTYRIFKYSEKVYIRLSFTPNAVTQDDVSLEFIGPKELTWKINETYARNKDDWDPEAGLHFNLKKILEIDCFIEQMEGNATEKDCYICMHYRDEEESAPIFSCDNLACDIQFHHNCVIKWWASQKLSNLFHNVAKGACPACKTFFELSKS